MQPYLPEQSQSQHNLRAPAHNKERVSETKELTERDNVVRISYKLYTE